MPEIQIDTIIMDSSTQTRAMNGLTIYDYTSLMKSGVKFPPVEIFEDTDGKLWLADGFHRVTAAKESGLITIDARISKGTQRDAILYALGPANATHGLPLSREEKQKRVEKMLADPEWRNWSDRQIAAHCGVSHPTVARIRERTGNFSSERTGADGRVQQVKHWGLSNGTPFWRRVETIGLDKLRIIGQLQDGAVNLTDLTMTKEEAWTRLDEIGHAHLLTKFPIGSFVKHNRASYFGKVRGITMGPNIHIDVLSLRYGTDQSWMLDACEPSTYEEWAATTDQLVLTPIQTDFSYGQEVTTRADASILLANEFGLMTQTLRKFKSGTVVQFVKAYRQNNNDLAECNWAGSPVILSLAMLIPVMSAPVPRDEPRPTNTPAPAAAAEIAPGTPVITRTGQIGTVTAISGRMAQVETANGTRPHYTETLAPAPAPRLTHTYTAEHVVELLADLPALLDYCEGDDIAADEELLATAERMCVFFIDLRAWIQEEISQEQSA